MARGVAERIVATAGVYCSAIGRYEDLRVVAFGGGKGLPVLLRGLRDRVGDLTAVVTVADDGGSSGRLRQELGVAPPGDVRNCLVALAGRRKLAEVFNYRFEGRGDLSDHSVGNIIIAALADMAGGLYVRACRRRPLPLDPRARGHHGQAEPRLPTLDDPADCCRDGATSCSGGRKVTAKARA